MIPAAPLDREGIRAIIPHREPFLLLDEVTELEPGVRARGRYLVKPDDWYLAGHFPGNPIMPGVLQVEAMAQVASILLFKNTGVGGKIGYFMSADKVKWRKPVLPGDTLIIEVEMIKFRGKIEKFHFEGFTPTK